MNSLILKSLKGITPLYFKRVLAQNTLVAGFHASIVIEKGRRGGATALDPKHRKPSKKQKKRKAAKREMVARQRDTSEDTEKVNKAQSRQIRKFVRSEDTALMYKETEAQIDKIWGEVNLPESFGVSDYKVSRQLPPLDYQQHFDYMKTLRLSSGLPPTPVTLSTTDKGGLILKEDGSLMSKEEVRDLEITSNRAIKELLQGNARNIHKRFTIAKGISNELSRNGLPTASVLYAKLIAVAAQTSRIAEANGLFALVSATEKNLSDDIWAARIDTLVASERFGDATFLFNERLEKNPDSECAVYVAQMNNLLEQKNYEGVKDIWMLLHDNGVKLTADAFAAAINRCTRLGEAERAFFLFDEMRIQRIEPNESVFIALINASGTAPHWVNGYQDTITDALCLLEGNEFVPTEGVYNAVIRAFGRAGDAVAAEYYFWEMRRKGILPTPQTYDALFEAYGTAQLVGATSRGMYGRYVRPKPKTPTKEELAYYALGPEKVAKIISAGFYADVETEKGKRAKAKIGELNEKEGEEALEEYNVMEMMSDARFLKQQAKEQEKKRLEIKQQRQQQLLNGGTPLLEAGGGAGAAAATGLESSNGSGTQQFQFSANSATSPRDSETMDLLDESVKSFSSKASKGEVEVNFDDLAKEDPDLRRLMELMRKDDPDLVPAVTVSEEQREEQEQEEADEEDRLLAMDPVMIALRSQSAEVANHTAQMLHSNYVLSTADEFYDPYAHVDDIKGRLVSDYKAGLIQKFRTGQALIQAEKTELVKMLDRTGSEQELLDLRAKQASGSMVTEEYVEYTWDLVNFGRPPYPDYDVSVQSRQAQNIHRAHLALQEFLADGMTLNAHILSKYLTIFTNLGDREGAEKVLRMYDEHGINKNKATYRALIMLNIRAHDLATAMRLKDEMTAEVGPDGEAYGTLIEGLTHQNKVVEALKIVEEAASYHLDIRKIHLMKVRARCNTLGVYHPDLGEDPRGWVKDLKHVRREKKLSSKRGIQHINSAFF